MAKRTVLADQSASQNANPEQFAQELHDLIAGENYGKTIGDMIIVIFE
jgi:hypothetical protein